MKKLILKFLYVEKINPKNIYFFVYLFYLFVKLILIIIKSNKIFLFLKNFVELQ